MVGSAVKKKNYIKTAGVLIIQEIPDHRGKNVFGSHFCHHDDRGVLAGLPAPSGSFLCGIPLHPLPIQQAVLKIDDPVKVLQVP